MANDYMPSFLKPAESEEVTELRFRVRDLETQIELAKEFANDPVVGTNPITGTVTRRDDHGHTYKMSRSEVAEEKAEIASLKAELTEAEDALFDRLALESALANAREDGAFAERDALMAAALEIDPNLLALTEQAGNASIEEIRKAELAVERWNARKRQADLRLNAAKKLGFNRKA